jgi:hypothetical protein
MAVKQPGASSRRRPRSLGSVLAELLSAHACALTRRNLDSVKISRHYADCCATRRSFWSSVEMLEQRLGCLRTVSNPNKDVVASSGSTLLKARIVLTVQGSANEHCRLGIGRVRKETEKAEGDGAETFSAIIKLSLLSKRIEYTEAVPEHPAPF